MAGWHQRLDGHEFEWTPGVGDGQGGLACCDSWGCKESDMTEQLNWTDAWNKTVCESESCSVLFNSVTPWTYTVHGILQASILEWVAFPFSRGPSQPRLKPGLPHCRQILYQLSHKRSPRILGWVAYPFSRGSSWPRNRTRVSCIAGGFFTNWALRLKGKQRQRLPK